MPLDELQPDWFHDNAPAYIAGGLTAAERERIEALARSNDTYRIELEELMSLDASMHRAAGVESIVAGLEARITAALPNRRWMIHPVVRRAALSAAACVVLGGFGYMASERMETNQLWGWSEPAQMRVASNLRQIGNGLELYSNENKGWFSKSFSSVKSAAGARDADGDGIVDGTHIIQKESEGKSFPPLSGKVNEPHHEAGMGRSESALSKNMQYSFVNVYPSNIGGYKPFITSSSDFATDGAAIPKGFIAPSGTAEADTHSNTVTAILETTKNHGQNGQHIRADYDGEALEGSRVTDLATLSLDNAFKPGDLGKAGSGTFVLNGANTYTGATVVSSGVLSVIGRDELNFKEEKKVSGKDAAAKPGDKFDRQVALDLFGKGMAAQKNAPAPVAPVAPPLAPAVDNRKIIRTGEMEFEVDRFDSAVAVVGKIVGDEKGFVATTASDKLANGKVRGQIIVRIPPDHLDAFVMQLRALGDLKSQRIGSADVTKEYTDLESELRSCRAMEERLLEMIKNGKGEIKDLLEAEKELAIWRGKIEKIIGQMKYYDNQVSLSTLTITLMERDIRAAAATVEQEAISAGVEADDVEKARAAALTMLGEAKARIVSADLNKLDAGQMASTIVADIPPDNAGPVIDRIKQLGKVARLEAKKSQTADPNNPATPDTKVERRDSRLTLSIYNVANVAARQSSAMNLAVADVQGAYSTIVAKVSKAGGRVVSGGATQSTGDNSRAAAQIEVPASAAEGFLMDLRSLGEVVALSTTSNPDTANVTESKRGFAINLYPIATLPPRQTGSFSIEAGDVEQASAGVQAIVMQVGGRIVGNNVQSNPGGVSSAALSIELPLDKSAEAIAAVRSAGKVLSVATQQNPTAPSGPAAKCRLDISFTTAGPITGETGGLMANLRNGFSLSAKGLVYSAQLVVIGLCFVLPWVLIIYIVSKLWKRRKPAVG